MRFRALGPLAGELDGRPLALGPPQQQALLAMLLLREGRPVSVRELLDGLWGERLPARAVGILRTYVSRLRTLLEPERRARRPATVLVSAGDGYALRLSAGSLDSGVYEARLREAGRLRAAGQTVAGYKELGAALGMWAGTPLAGLPGPYAQRQRERLTELWLSAQETHFHCALELGRHADAVGALRVFAGEHPLRERTQALLMLALHRTGHQGDAFAVYAAACRTLDAELGVGPGPELRALHARLLKSEPEPVRAQPVPAVTRCPVPAQLPLDVPDFIGRRASVARLGGLLRDASAGKTMAVASLTGLGGVGKTALAVHVAHSLREEFPDGQLYVDLRGGTPAPAESSDVLVHLLHSLGVADRDVPEGTEERAALYRSLLAGRRVLVLLDNVRDTAQVRPLLPGVRGCAVVITSRSRTIVVPGSRLIPVDPMSEPEALALLGAIIGPERVAAEPDAAHELVTSCGFLPLAVRIAAARLLVRPQWSLADLAARLRDEPGRLDELRVGGVGVEAAFRRSYEMLEPGAARAFRRVAAAAGVTVLGRFTVAAMLGTGAYEAREAMESLVDAGLLEENGTDSYCCHDLVRLFARRQLERSADPDERAAAMVLRSRTNKSVLPAGPRRSAPALVPTSISCPAQRA
ncbi:AfsR/SARP family transcriptional regulator [Streptomyces beijiangensis]|uniref:Winged helix-turn-helix domain-containing protein n=1 Tax=Streptomyces beijiangensis TaxID=163361 RepID=A0A939FF09_9ACTN|nr:AfsR/SARP family transcriptional regulator [Streptomyces beijiangensis]MBO0516956.1 winged helix-turn-helix domain-containing protein [Streptomyces beijiangensis]